MPHKFISKYNDVMKKLFRVVLSTPNNNYIRWNDERYDYVIIDESSQMFTEVGLPLLSIGNIKIASGDSKQLRPSRWFTVRDDEDTEEAESILDYVIEKGVNKVMLDKNYRSDSASLMSFSSKHFYNCNLDVCTRRGIGDNTIVVENVDGVWQDGVNVIEVVKVIEILESISNIYSSFIILAFNRKQKDLIEQTIYETSAIGVELLENKKLILRNIENIQGDEAEVVIASVVYTPETRMGATYVTRSGGSNALNVAVSRAKKKLFVVKSVNYHNISTANSDDFQIFKHWLKFLDLPASEQKEYSANENNKSVVEAPGSVDLKFESDVIDRLLTDLKLNTG